MPKPSIPGRGGGNCVPSVHFKVSLEKKPPPGLLQAGIGFFVHSDPSGYVLTVVLLATNRNLGPSFPN